MDLVEHRLISGSGTGESGLTEVTTRSGVKGTGSMGMCLCTSGATGLMGGEGSRLRGVWGRSPGPSNGDVGGDTGNLRR